MSTDVPDYIHAGRGRRPRKTIAAAIRPAATALLTLIERSEASPHELFLGDVVVQMSGEGLQIDAQLPSGRSVRDWRIALPDCSITEDSAGFQSTSVKAVIDGVDVSIWSIEEAPLTFDTASRHVAAARAAIDLIDFAPKLPLASIRLASAGEAPAMATGDLWDRGDYLKWVEVTGYADECPGSQESLWSPPIYRAFPVSDNQAFQVEYYDV